MIEKITEIIVQEHKAHQDQQVTKEFKAFKVPLVLMAHKVHLDKRVKVY
jgi:hypothetical protein